MRRRIRIRAIVGVAGVAAAAGALHTQLYAWTKAYVGTPAFKAEYLKHRESQKPQLYQPTETVEEEFKAKVDKEN